MCMTPANLNAELNNAPAKVVDQLWQAGIRSKNDVLDILQTNPDGRNMLVKFLNLPAKEMLVLLDLRQFPEHSGATLSLSFGFGALAPTQSDDPVAEFDIKSLPDHFSLSKHFQPARNQGTVGTCTSFGVISVLESQIKNHDFSERFLYYYTKMHDGHPDSEGSYVRVAIKMLAKYGTCLERSWPYIDDRAKLRQAPSNAANREAIKYRPKLSPIALSPKSVEQFKHQIASGRGVAFSVPIFNSSKYSLKFNSEGRYIMRLGILDKVAGWHAMGAIGFFDNEYLAKNGLDDSPGGGLFLVRNSWGTGWAKNNPVAKHDGAGPGYALIPYAYIAKYCGEAYTIDAKANRSLLSSVTSGSTWWSNVCASVVGQSQSRLAEVSEMVRAK